ncbi:armadillo-type protein [Cokeromyces recurvatus]|uniref:armadillo-type protein n=1 Tax=Cokeromyces recurvatus TaxID=90255 RepID=UPI00221E8780|nr:armadillo-type protein [Cokeromyces recurvatus]KAI7907269.1 armadillo-type protein [Cokeromyces recurvatus]
MVVNEFEPDDVLRDLNRKFANVSLENQIDDTAKVVLNSNDIYECRNVLLSSDDYQLRQIAIKNIRRYLTQNISLSRIEMVFELDIDEILKTILETPGYDELKYEAAWIITNLAYGTREHTAKLVDSGVINSLVYCFRNSENFRVKSQSAWALANVSIESPSYRERMAQSNLISDIAQALTIKCEIVYNKLNAELDQEQIPIDERGQIRCKSKEDSDDVKDLTWSLANICRGGFKTIEHWEQYLVAVNAFSQCIHFDNEEIWTEACWGLSRILSNMYNYDPFFHSWNLHPRLCPRLVNLLRNQPSDAILPVLQTISNFSSGPNEYIEILLNADLLNNIWWYLSPDTIPQLRRNAMLTISNLAAGSEQMLRKVVYNENIMQGVIAHLVIPGHIYYPEERNWFSSAKAINPESKEEWRILKEALWVLTNITTLANDDCICALLRSYPKLIKLLASLLFFSRLPEPIILKIVETLIHIIDRTNKIVELTPPVQPIPRNHYAEEMVREDIIPALRFLSQHIDDPALSSQIELLNELMMSSFPQHYNSNDHLAVTFGLSSRGIQLAKPDVRRIVHGFEDGDVRLIEDAIVRIQL